MKIKQSFIDRCGEITVKQVKEIAKESRMSRQSILYAILDPQGFNYAHNIWQATANVLKISLSDIYEVEQLPNTLTE